MTGDRRTLSFTIGSGAFVLIVALAAVTAADEPSMLTARVVNIHDGDTITVLDGGGTQRRVRLEGIDAPEMGQAFGAVARGRLATLVKGKTVSLHIHGQDRYGRTLATVDVGGHDVAGQMIADGLAWHYKRYSHDRVLAVSEDEARRQRRGLWADREPVPPWEWRQSERDRKTEAHEPVGR